METTATIKESGAAGKPGEGTAPGKPAAVKADTKNLTPDGVTSLLSSAFAEATPPDGPVKPEAKPAGEEVQPGGEGDGGPAPEGEKLTPEVETPAGGTEAGTEGGEPEGQTAAGRLPEHLEAELVRWEETGGELPAPLQKLVERRINKLVGERETHKERADTAEAEVQRLAGELETAKTAGPAAASAAAPGAIDEKSLTGMIDASKKFQADARAYIGGYADEAASKRVEQHMAAAGLDDKGLRRQLDEVGDWLTTGAPQLRDSLKQFKTQEAQFTPVVQSRFPTLADPKTAEGKLGAEISRLMPELSQRTPSHALAKAIYVLGFTVYDHMTAASKEGDILAAVRQVLKQHVPVATGGKPAVLPGKAPVKAAPTGGSPVKAPAGSRKDAQQDQVSEELRNSPTAENAAKALRLSLN